MGWQAGDDLLVACFIEGAGATEDPQVVAAGVPDHRPAVVGIEIDPRKLGQVIHGAPVVGINTLIPGVDRTLVTVGTKGARAQVRELAAQRDLVEGDDFLCVT